MLFRTLVHATAKTSRTILSQRLLAVAVMVLAAIGAPLAASAASQSNSSAYGESVDLHLLPLLGNGITLTSGPLPTRAGAAPPAFDLTQQVASVAVSSPLLGTVLQTGILKTHAASTLPGQDSAVGDAEVNGLALRIAGALPLLTLSADTVVSNAAITGPCTGAPTAAGATTLTNVVLGGPAGIGLTVPVHPAPNFVLLNVLGIRVVLNEQIATGSGLTRGLTVNAIHVSVTNSVLAGLGVLSGDIVIAQSQAALTCVVPLPDSANVSLSAFATPAQAHVGDAGQIAFVINNLGPNAASQIAFSGTIAGPATVQSIVPSQGSCTGGTNSSCTIGTLPAGGSATVTVHLITTAVGLITGTGSAVSPIADPTPGNNQGSATIDVRAQDGPPPASADLGMTATASPQIVHVNDAASITFRIDNHGPDAAANVTLAGSITGATAIQSIVASQGACSGTTSPSCSLGTVASGGFVTVTVQHRPTAVGTIVGTASVGSPTTDPTPGNNQASVSANVLPATGPPPASADLGMTATASPQVVHVNDSASITFRIDNHGPNAASNVALAGSITGATAIQSIVASQGSCSGTTSPSCALGTVASGGFVTVTVQHRPTAVGTIVGTASVGS
ncbi:MAG TPA: DUF11 domain-containing protein, partial [Thermoanaerobaculia bacterium]|nr:DUF11 domain-containing protein [Thermoanaerobaculia bacterium]